MQVMEFGDEMSLVSQGGLGVRLAQNGPMRISPKLHHGISLDSPLSFPTRISISLIVVEWTYSESFPIHHELCQLYVSGPVSV